jgi:glutamate--cysteine ligase
MHLNTLFPEVRLKKTIEIRGADAQPARLVCALPALWTGILYDDRALAEAEAMTADWTHAEVSALREQIWKLGLKAPFRGAPIQGLAEKMITISEGGLERRAIQRPDGKDERVHLAGIKALVARGFTPGDELLDAVKPGDGFEKRVIAAADLLRQ